MSRHDTERSKMAHSSRHPPSRGVSPTTLSSSHHHSKHHTRKKSGEGERKERRVSRPGMTSRRSSTQVVKLSGSRRERDREYNGRDEESERDSGESFPMFCMTCEKQFVPANSTFLYCSEACRMHDNAPQQCSKSTPSTTSQTPPHTPYLRTSIPSDDGGPDIIPRFSPTQSRPRSYFNSDPYPNSPPTTTTTTMYARGGVEAPPGRKDSTALASLRELAEALPKSGTSRRTDQEKREDDSPPESLKRSGSGVWDYIPSIPFTTSSSKTQPPTPSSSYTVPPYSISQSYGGAGKSREDLNGYYNAPMTGYAGYVKSQQYSYANVNGMGMDRPLPQRGAPGGYGHRPRSIDLVTPFSRTHGGN